MLKTTAAVVAAVAVLAAGQAMAAPAYAPPPGGWQYIYDGSTAASTPGAALDGTWDHNSGSDEWDGTIIGAGRPGGAMSMTAGSDTFLRIQDTGDPRDYGMGDPGSNRKIGFTRDISTLLPTGYETLDDGVTLSFRARIATTPPLDDVHPDGGGGITPWPAGGDGYVTHDGGKGPFGAHQENGTDQTISFALALPSDDDDVTTAGLVMNKLNGGSPNEDVDLQGESGGNVNLLPVADPTQFHEFWVTIHKDKSGGGTHRVDVYADGATTPTTFHVTAGSKDDEGYEYLELYHGATPQSGAMDVDFYAVHAGTLAPGQRKALGGVTRGGGSNNATPFVVPGGLQEDIDAFVDRDHEYNNIPASLLGADYVQVANDDKTVGDYSLDVTLDEMSDVYLFIDNRVGDDTGQTDPNDSPTLGGGIMDWVLAMGFTDTGEAIGIDEGGDGDVDSWASVYCLEDVPAGLLSLGAQDDGGSRNMYGVAAVPSEIIPEPATLTLLGLGCAGLVGALRRRRRT